MAKGQVEILLELKSTCNELAKSKEKPEKDLKRLIELMPILDNVFIIRLQPMILGSLAPLLGLDDASIR